MSLHASAWWNNSANVPTYPVAWLTRWFKGMLRRESNVRENKLYRCVHLWPPTQEPRIHRKSTCCLTLYLHLPCDRERRRSKQGVITRRKRICVKETESRKDRHEICLWNETPRGQDFSISLGALFQDVKQNQVATTRLVWGYRGLKTICGYTVSMVDNTAFLICIYRKHLYKLIEGL